MSLKKWLKSKTQAFDARMDGYKSYTNAIDLKNRQLQNSNLTPSQRQMIELERDDFIAKLPESMRKNYTSREEKQENDANEETTGGKRKSRRVKKSKRKRTKKSKTKKRRSTRRK